MDFTVPSPSITCTLTVTLATSEVTLQLSMTIEYYDEKAAFISEKATVLTEKKLAARAEDGTFDESITSKAGLPDASKDAPKDAREDVSAGVLMS